MPILSAGAAMDVKLVVQNANRSGQIMRLRQPELIVGRQRGCGVRIPSGQVSRQHCLLTFKHEVLAVEDLNSANGTFINGRRIAKREYLRPGDKLKVGPITMLVQYQLSETGVQHLLGADEEEFVAVPLDDVQVLASAGDHAEVEVLMDVDDDVPLIMDEPLDDPAPAVDPLEALRAIEAKATVAPAKKNARVAKPKRAPQPTDDDDLETLTATPPLARPKVTAPAAALDEEESADEPAPDASQILGKKNWQLPTGEDIRDILAQIEKGKKKT